MFSSSPTIERHGTALPVWMDSEPVDTRMNVCVAVLLGQTGWSNSSALAVLRGYAFSHDTTLDAVAEAMVHQRLTASTIIGVTEPP